MTPELWAFIGLLALSAYFSGSETAFTSLTPEQISRLVKKYGTRGRLVEAIMVRPELMISTILVGNNIVNTASAALATYLTLQWFGNAYLAAGTGAVTLLTLVFGEVTPKQIAIIHNEFIAVHSVRFLSLLLRIFYPLTWVLGLLSTLVVHLLGGKKARALSQDSVLQVLASAHSQGLLGDQETRFVRNMFRIKDTPVKAFLTHRTDLFALNQDLSVKEALPKLTSAGYSRVPIYQDSMETVTGILLLKNMIGLSDRDELRPLKDFAVPPVFVPGSKKARDMFQQFQKQNFNLAVVLDEYQSLLGIVTREDVIEEIMGELYDEDEKAEGERIVTLGKNRWRLRGDTPLHQIEESLQISLSGFESETLTGCLTEILGRLPQAGDRIDLPQGHFTLLEVGRHRVKLAEFLKNTYEDEGSSF